MALLNIFGSKKKKISAKTESNKIKKAEGRHKKAPEKQEKKSKPAVYTKKHLEKIPDEKAFELLKKYRIPTPQQFFVKNESEIKTIVKRLKFPVVMKISGPVLHRTELGGIIKDINSEQAVFDAFKRLMKIKGCEKVIIQPQYSGIELIIGAKYTKEFGYVVSVGLGGIYTEILKDVALRVCPLSKTDAAVMVNELKGAEILKGVRGKPINLEALYDVIQNTSRLAVNEKINQMDINPLFCDENGCYAVDVRIIK